MKLELDEAGGICSLVPVSSNRQLCRPGAPMNAFLCGEDVSEAWDNWDIDEDQKLKLTRGNRPPYYPEVAHRNGWTGLCLVRIAVTAQGQAGAVSLARSSGHGILDQAALSAVRKWKFSPRMVRGHAVTCAVEVPVNFSLR